MSIIKALSDIPRLLPTPDGAYTFKHQQRFIHSTRSPLKEAQKLIKDIEGISPKSTVIILWGTGLGYHAELLLQQNFNIIAVETRKDVLEIFKKTFPTEKLLGLIENIDDSIFNLLVDLDQKKVSRFIDIVMPGYDIPQQLLVYSEKGKNALRSTHAIYLSLMESWYHNILQNLALYHNNQIGYTTYPIFQNQEVLICSAGPSLKESLPYIKKLQKNLTILCTDTALQALIQAQIIPDYVHAVDAKLHNIGDFSGISDHIIGQMILIADITLSSSIVSLPWKKILFTTTAQPITTKDGIRYHQIELLKHIPLLFPEIQTGGSVANSAFHVALFYQAKKVLLVGQDLAYTNHRGHASGTPYDTEYRINTSRLNSLGNIHIHKVPFNYPIQGINEAYTWGDPLLIQFRHWFETSLLNIPELKSKVLNVSENGALFKYWDHLSLKRYTSITTKNIPNFSLTSIDPVTIKKIITGCDILNPNSHLYQEYFYKEIADKQDDLFIINRKLKRLKNSLQRYYGA